jgi:hypothetical protein
MSDPERLIQGGDELEQALLRAGASDGPSELSRQKVAAGLGIGAAAHAPWSAGGLMKWMGGAVVALALVGGAAHLLRPEKAPTSQVPTTNQAIATPTSPEPSPADSIALAPPTQVADASVESARPKVVRRPPKAATALPKTKKNASTLDAEMALLDGARASLRAGRPGDALRTLDGYDAQFPRGLLVPEATVVRIEALVNNGDKPGALRLGERFLRAHPDSPLAARVRTLTNS